MLSDEDTIQSPPDVDIDDVLPPLQRPPGQLPPDTDTDGLLPPPNTGDDVPPILPELPAFFPEAPSQPDELPEVEIDWNVPEALAVNLPPWWQTQP